MRVERIVSKGDVVIYQHPAYGNRVTAHFISRIQKKKECRFLALIHDLESLRGGIQGFTNISEKTSCFSDNELLKLFDGVLCHNDRMKEYMVKNGFNEEKIFNLQIFDYLGDDYYHEEPYDGVPSIMIAGNLSRVKCGYIYKICEKGCNSNLRINLFGGNFDGNLSISNITYHGSFKPEELNKHLTGKFGLIWDGNSADSCEGNTGEYLKYNNPHKASLYLSNAVPVIVWSKAALAGFVRDNNVGIVVDNLHTIENIINAISAEEYEIMRHNAMKISKRLHNGYYFYKALDAFLSNG
jgi:hypothetical protein